MTFDRTSRNKSGIFQVGSFGFIVGARTITFFIRHGNGINMDRTSIVTHSEARLIKEELDHYLNRPFTYGLQGTAAVTKLPTIDSTTWPTDDEGLPRRRSRKRPKRTLALPKSD